MVCCLIKDRHLYTGQGKAQVFLSMYHENIWWNEVQFPSLLTLVLDEYERSPLHASCFNVWERAFGSL